MIKYNPDIHHRRSIRLKGYDYTQSGLYFITLCTKNRENLFGEITNGEMILSDAGRMVEKWWKWLAEQYEYVVLHDFIIMPNHFHSIIEIKTSQEKIKPIGRLVGAFKTVSTKEICRGGSRTALTRTAPTDEIPIPTIWQRDYYEHIIRDEKSYIKISDYIINNPLNWQEDKYHA